MTINNRCHVSTSEILFWDIPGKRDLLKKLELDSLLPLSGYRVMNLASIRNPNTMLSDGIAHRIRRKLGAIRPLDSAQHDPRLGENRWIA